MRRSEVFARPSAVPQRSPKHPNNDGVLAATESEEELSVAAISGDDTPTHTTKSSEGSRTRHAAAVWASGDNTTLGSTVTFEANLHRSDAGGTKSTAASSAFAHKSFEITIALTDGDNSDQAVVALP